MPVISRFFGIVIAIYWEDHSPPHFHEKYNEFECLMSIEDGSIVRGALPSRALRLVEEWRTVNLDMIRADWLLAQQRKPLNAVPPLE